MDTEQKLQQLSEVTFRDYNLDGVMEPGSSCLKHSEPKCWETYAKQTGKQILNRLPTRGKGLGIFRA